MKNINVLQNNNKRAEINEMVEAVMIRNANNMATLMEDVMKAKQNDIEIDLSDKAYQTTKYLNMIQVMARLGYAAGSEVGLIIVALSIGDTLKDMELNKQFLVSGTNKVCMYKMKKVFKNIGKGHKVGYDKIFSDDMFLNITDVFGRKTFMLLALKVHVVKFIEQINSIGELYQEDLVKIGIDLGIIATVVSEIEIDSAKKPELKEGLPEVSSYMSQNMNLRSRELYVRNNFDKIVECVKDPKRKDRIEFKSFIEENGMPLFKFDEEWDKRHKEIINSERYKNSSEEDQIKTINSAKSFLLSMCYVVDPLSEFSQALHDQQAENINILVETYRTSTDKIFDFNMGLTGEKAKAANKVKYVTIKVVNMINYVFANKKDMTLPKLDEACIDYRNMLYTYGEKLGLSPEETFCTCADAGWYNIRFNTRTEKQEYFKKDSYSFKAMEMLFGNELKYFFNAEVMRKEVDIELPEEIFEIENAIYHGMKLEFVDGEALICDSEEHGELYAFRNDVDEYTGSVVIEVDKEGYVKFREEFQAFNFERVEFIIFDGITNSRKKAENLMNNEIIEVLKQSSLTNDIDAFEYKFKECKLEEYDMDAHKESIEAFNKYITLASNSTNENRFEIFTGGRGYAYLLHNGSIGRMIGHVLEKHTETSISKASIVKAHTTGVGSIVIIKK